MAHAAPDTCSDGLEPWIAACSLGKATTCLPKSDSEVTLYIRGFMSTAESSYEQVVWRRNHDDLVSKLKWSATALDYRWSNFRSSGVPDFLPEPVARGITFLGLNPVPVFSSFVVVQKAMHAVCRSRSTRNVLSTRVPRVRAAVIADTILGTGRLYVQWCQAAANARSQDEINRLRMTLKTVRARYQRVRVVSYSLGCQLLLITYHTLESNLWPDETHLLAAAVQTSEAQHLLCASRRSGITHVYFSQDDHVLNLLFGVVEGEQALGSTGLRWHSTDSLSLPIVNHDTSLLQRERVSSWNPLVVHLMYREIWADIAADQTGEQSTS